MLQSWLNYKIILYDFLYEDNMETIAGSRLLYKDDSIIYELGKGKGEKFLVVGSVADPDDF